MSTMQAKKYVAAVLGGSGSVGQHVLKTLLKDSQCTKVILLSRRELNDLKELDPTRIHVEICNPLDDMSKVDLSGTNVAFCTLGHGVQSRQGSRRKVDRGSRNAVHVYCATGDVVGESAFAENRDYDTECYFADEVFFCECGRYCEWYGDEDCQCFSGG
mmetsp:Transcript_6430/g.13917  ORF Transcript_6430/g.13917 Transcript_6430/m.13917 type:complete len:159 (+) Transcript_6430:48-524(+)